MQERETPFFTSIQLTAVLYMRFISCNNVINSTAFLLSRGYTEVQYACIPSDQSYSTEGNSKVLVSNLVCQVAEAQPRLSNRAQIDYFHAL